MIIKYKNSVDDFIKWGMYSFKKDLSIQKRINLLRIIIPSIIIFTFTLIILSDRSHKINITFLIVCIIVILLWVIFYPKIIEFKYNNQLKRTFSSSKRICSEKVLTIDQYGIRNKSKDGFAKFSWNEIEKVIDLDTYIYIYIDDLSAIIIPSSAFENEEEKKELLKVINENIKK
ncbi:YcxB family protein [Clostridium perfringens]|uniref:YcxB family protein n=1 Tax=Clostridium perfringens TaxID=1502 RepID=UPI0039E7F92E